MLDYIRAVFAVCFILALVSTLSLVFGGVHMFATVPNIGTPTAVAHGYVTIAFHVFGLAALPVLEYFKWTWERADEDRTVVDVDIDTQNVGRA